MFNTISMEITEFVVHKIGNRANEKGIEYSEKAITPTDEQSGVLLSLFLNPFKTEEYMKFKGSRSKNKVFDLVANINENSDNFVELSHYLAEHYHSFTVHPKIKEGNFYIVKFTGAIIDDEVVNAIGIFKSETTEPFVKIKQDGDTINAEREDGINLKKIDRALLIFNTNKDDGYKVLNVDKSKSQEHWLEFLEIEKIEDEFESTSQYIDTFAYAIEAMIEQEDIDVIGKAKLLQNADAYFNNAEAFETEVFDTEVFEGNETVAKAYSEAVEEYESETDIEIPKEFDISQSAVSSRKSYFKSVMNLDKNFKLEIKGDTTEIEQGYDSSRKKRFFKVYFDEIN